MLGMLEQEELKTMVMGMAERMIDYIEVAITNHENYLKLRSRVLRLSNDICRRIDKMGINEVVKKNGKNGNGNGKGE